MRENAVWLFMVNNGLWGPHTLDPIHMGTTQPISIIARIEGTQDASQRDLQNLRLSQMKEEEIRNKRESKKK